MEKEYCGDCRFLKCLVQDIPRCHNKSSEWYGKQRNIVTTACCKWELSEELKRELDQDTIWNKSGLGNSTERKAGEAEPMAVLVKNWAECCEECDEIKHDKGFYYICPYTNTLIDKPKTKPVECPFHKAIGIIEPNGHVVYLGEVDA